MRRLILKAPGDADTDNVYDVQVTVTDSGGLSDVQDLTVTVGNANEDPVITSVSAISVAEKHDLCSERCGQR